MEEKRAEKFICNICNFNTSKEFNYNRHIKTDTHKRKQMETARKQKGADKYCCDKCNSYYKTRAGLWKHNKRHHCTDIVPVTTDIVPVTAEVKQLMAYIDQLKTYIEQLKSTTNQSNAELKAEVIKLNNIIHERVSNSYNNCNNTNNTLTVNVFLDEKCKDALNMPEFIELIKPSIEQVFGSLDTTYAIHMSNLFIEGIKQLDPTERPIHCCDIKRNHHYVKKNDIWLKDETGEKLNNAFGQIEHKQVMKLKEWEKDHPEWIDDERKAEKLMTTLGHILGGGDEQKYIRNRREAARLVNEIISLKAAIKANKETAVDAVGN